MQEGLRPALASEDAAIRYLVEGTAAHTGPEFFSALVKHLAFALGVNGAWVTELCPDGRRLRALAFWLQDRYVPDYEYTIENTPCGTVVETASLFHVPDNVIELFPLDPDLVSLNAVSYLGLPLLDEDGSVLGHLAAIDGKPLPLTSRLEALLRIFGARAGAEMQRLRSESRTRERERQLSSVLDGAWEAILVVDEAGTICQANRAGVQKFQVGIDNLIGTQFTALLSDEAAGRWQEMAAVTAGRTQPHAWWISNLEVRTPAGSRFPAEASLSGFERDGRRYWSIILRDLQEQREAERRLTALQEESRYLREELEDLRPVGQLLGESAAMRAVFGQIRQVAPTDATVLILGETGTGKELVARAIHDASSRRGKPMVRVNCGAIPYSLMESEFFGHEKGAFTGAVERREGRFALADGGTLFLDEIGELPLDVQVKLLRVLQEGEFEPVGSGRTRKVNVRAIAATNRNLAEEVARGRFRADLFYRLSVFPLSIPPLRERGDDIVLLADAFIERFGKKMNRCFRMLGGTARDLLRRYDWPGNVRELENVLERATILARGDEIRLDERMLPVSTPCGAPAQPPKDPLSVLTVKQLEDLERENLVRALETCAGRVAGESGAAKLLGIAPSTLTSRMKALRVARIREGSPNPLA
jgi:formate hydrogenlyase transcriptional activator